MHDYQINFDLIDGSGYHSQKSNTKTRTNLNNNFYSRNFIPKINPKVKEEENKGNVEPKENLQTQNTQQENKKEQKPKQENIQAKRSAPEYVTYPVYFFRPAEIDGRLWIPQPVNLDMPMQNNPAVNYSEWPLVKPVQSTTLSQQSNAGNREPAWKPPVNQSQTGAAASARYGQVKPLSSYQQKKRVDLKPKTPTYSAPKVEEKTEETAVAARTKTRTKPVGKLWVTCVVILWAILAFLLAFEVTSLLSRPTERDALPMPFGYALVSQNSNNMTPFMKQNDLGLVVKQDKYAVDTPIVYVNDADIITVSRYIGMDNKGHCRAMADNSKSVDKPFDQSQIRGKVVFVIPQGSFFLQYFGDLILLGVVIILLIVCYRWRHKRKHT